jgi:hypothetical protein
MTATKAKTLESSKSEMDAWGGAGGLPRPRLIGVSGGGGADILAKSGSVDSTPVYICGVALGYENPFSKARIVGIIHSGGSCAVAVALFALPGVFRTLCGVFGAVRVNADAVVAAFWGVSGARADVGAGRALSRYVYSFL